MGKIRAKAAVPEKDTVPKASLKTIVKPKDKVAPSTPVKAPKEKTPKTDFPKRPLPALKRKQKAKKASAAFAKNQQDAGKDGEPRVHQKKHVKMAEKKQKLAMKFELMLKEQQDAAKQKKADKAIKKLGSVATLGAIKDALPSLDGLLKYKTAEDIKSGIPHYNSIKVQGASKKTAGKQPKDTGAKAKKENKFAVKEKKITKEKKEMFNRYDYLQKLMNDKVFRANPRAVIAEHIRNTKLEEEAK